MKWLILLMGIGVNAAASVLIKLAMTPPRRLPTFSEPLSLLANGPLLTGLVLYGMAFLLYAAALARLPLNVAHPILTAGAVAAVALLSALIFNEPMYPTRVAGIVLVIVGVVLITLRAS